MLCHGSKFSFFFLLDYYLDERCWLKNAMFLGRFKYSVLLSIQIAGFSITPGSGGYNSQNGATGGHTVSRLKSQLSFTRQDSLSQISEVNESVAEGMNSNNGRQNSSHSYAAASFSMEPWDNTNSIVFSGPPSKRAKNIDGDIFNCLNGLETQVLELFLRNCMHQETQCYKSSNVL